MSPDLIAICARVLGVEPTVLTPETSSENLPAWDSLKHWEILAGVEAHFKVEFSMDESMDFDTLGDVQAALVQRGCV